MMQEKKENINELSGATGLILTTFSCIVTILSTNVYTHALFTIWLFFILLYLGFCKQGIGYLLIYLLSIFWLIKMIPMGVKFPSPMLLGLIYKFILPIMAAFLTLKIPSGKVISALRKLPLSKNIMLVLIVMIRFAPTVIGEFKSVREAMKVRGFIGNGKKVIIHPLKMLEYAVVPMIFRSIKVADELAAASIVRGIENPCRKESYYDCKFSYKDIVMLTISLVLGIFVIIY